MFKARFLLPVLLLMLALPLATHAFMTKAADSVYIGADETVDGNLYAAGNNITIDGTITGDVICAAQTVNINGSVAGDVICAAQSLNLQGKIGGSARVAGNTVNLNGPVARGVQAFGANVTLGKNAAVGWGMLIACGTAEIRGKIGGDLYGAAGNAIIDGDIAKNVRLRLENNIKGEKRGFGFEADTSSLTVTDNAKVGGDLVYTAPNAAAIASSSSIAGVVTHNLPKVKKARGGFGAGYFLGRLFSIFAALVVGLVLISLWSGQIRTLTDRMLKRPAPAVGWGIVVMFITPILALILLITLIGIPLAFILMALWLIALYASKILVGILAGRWLLNKTIKNKSKDSLIWAMIAGIVITWIIYSIPIIGWLLALAAMWWGLGGLWLYFKKV